MQNTLCLPTACVVGVLDGTQITTISIAVVTGIGLLSGAAALAIQRISKAITDAEKERADTMAGTIAGQFEAVKQQMATQGATLQAAHDLIKIQEARDTEKNQMLTQMSARVEDCNKKGHDARNEFQAEILKRDALLHDLSTRLDVANNQITHLTEQLAKTNDVITQLQQENTRLLGVMAENAKARTINAVTLDAQSAQLKTLHEEKVAAVAATASGDAGPLVVNTDKPVTINTPSVEPPKPGGAA